LGSYAQLPEVGGAAATFASIVAIGEAKAWFTKPCAEEEAPGCGSTGAVRMFVFVPAASFTEFWKLGVGGKVVALVCFVTLADERGWDKPCVGGCVGSG
jgi:hypothetical protein